MDADDWANLKHMGSFGPVVVCQFNSLKLAVRPPVMSDSVCKSALGALLMLVCYVYIWQSAARGTNYLPPSPSLSPSPHR